MKMVRFAVLLLVGSLAALPLRGQVEIVSFEQDGRLVSSNLLAGSTATVEWASSPAGPWTNSWADLEAVTVDSNGVLDVSVPLFYRVRGAGVTTSTSSTTIPSMATSSTTTSTSSSTTTAPAGMALIPAGSFEMGDSFSEGWSAELPVHSVYVSGFYMDKYEVTKALWDEVRAWGQNNGYMDLPFGSSKAANHPVQQISWYEMLKWCNARSEKEGRTPAYYTSSARTTVYRTGSVNVPNDWVRWDTGYRLPTEAEWEKAARGGASGWRFPWGDTINHDHANYYANGSDYSFDTSPYTIWTYHPTYNTGGTPYTSPVGSFSPNGYGLYDMAGNVWEWTWDLFDNSYYESSPSTDPRGPTLGSDRVFRGGCWHYGARICRVAFRLYNDPGIADSLLGFRVVLPAQ